MKKTALVLLLLAALSGVLLFAPREGGGEGFLRIHIRAHSDRAADQAVKYKVKDGVVAFLTPHLADCRTFETALELLEARRAEIEAAADRVLAESGFLYKSRAAVAREDFPTRSYDGFTLPAGAYDALIVWLGEGAGDNWWCVVYPPLCFINAAPNGTEEIRYRSKLLEIIKNFKSKKA